MNDIKLKIQRGTAIEKADFQIEVRAHFNKYVFEDIRSKGDISSGDSYIALSIPKTNDKLITFLEEFFAKPREEDDRDSLFSAISTLFKDKMFHYKKTEGENNTFFFITFQERMSEVFKS